MSSDSELIEFPKLIDSSVSTGIITLDEDYSFSKERQTKINLTILHPENNKCENLNFACDYSNLVNVAYKLKSTCNQIEQSINNLTK
jgi:hypothetical protein